MLQTLHKRDTSQCPVWPLSVNLLYTDTEDKAYMRRRILVSVY
jgi:hypothetical protein